jgi:hypothetical protein
VPFGIGQIDQKLHRAAARSRLTFFLSPGSK